MRGISSMEKAATCASASAFSGRVLAVGVHDGDDERAGLVARQLALGRAADLEDDIRVLEGLGRRSAAIDGAGGLVFRIGNAGLRAGARPGPTTSAPRPLYFLTVSGVAATRVSAHRFRRERRSACNTPVPGDLGRPIEHWSEPGNRLSGR